MTKVLLLRFGALGDLLLAVPAILGLRSQVPGAHITLVGHEQGVALLAASSIIDEGISQDDPRLLGLFVGGREDLSRATPLGKFDVVFGWLGDPASQLAENLQKLGGKAFTAPTKPPEFARTHVADFLQETLSPLGLARCSESHSSLRIPLDDDDWAVSALGTVNRNGAPIVSLHPGSGSSRKNWPASDFAKTANLLTERGILVLLICGPADDLAVSMTFSELKNQTPVFRDLPLSRLSALIARCDAYLGNDSGITHLAALTGVSTVALFGPTDPEVWGPRGEKVTVLRWESERENLSPEQVAEIILQRFDLSVRTL